MAKEKTKEEQPNKAAEAVSTAKASAIDPTKASEDPSNQDRNTKPAKQTPPEPAGPDNQKPAAAEPPEIKAASVDLNVILDIPLEITVELGRTRMPIHELLELGPGSAVALTRLEGEPVDLLANNTLIARGVVLVNNNRYGIRITEITSYLDRIKRLK